MLVYLYSDKVIACCVYCMKCAPASVNITRSQGVAKIADRTASQYCWRTRDVIGHVTI